MRALKSHTRTHGIGRTDRAPCMPLGIPVAIDRQEHVPPETRLHGAVELGPRRHREEPLIGIFLLEPPQASCVFRLRPPSEDQDLPLFSQRQSQAGVTGRFPGDLRNEDEDRRRIIASRLEGDSVVLDPLDAENGDLADGVTHTETRFYASVRLGALPTHLRATARAAGSRAARARRRDAGIPAGLTPAADLAALLTRDAARLALRAIGLPASTAALLRNVDRGLLLAVRSRSFAPESAPFLARAALGGLELLHPAEGVLHVREAIPLANDLEMEEASVREVDVGERPSVAIARSGTRIPFEPHTLALRHPLRERGRLTCKGVDWLSRMDALRRIDSDEPYGLAAVELERVNVDHAHDEARAALVARPHDPRQPERECESQHRPKRASMPWRISAWTLRFALPCHRIMSVAIQENPNPSCQHPATRSGMDVHRS